MSNTIIRALTACLTGFDNKVARLASLMTTVEMGVVKGYRYRFFKSEGWIGLKTPDCPPGESRSFQTKEDFIRMVESLPVSAQ